MTTTVPVFLAAERSLFVVLGTDVAPVLTWDRDYETALDFARIHNGLVVAVPVLADYTVAGPFPEGADAPARDYVCPQCGPTHQSDDEHTETHHTVRFLRSPMADVFDLPHRTPPPPVPLVPSAVGPEPEEPPHIGWALGGRDVEPADGWNFEREPKQKTAPEAIVGEEEREAMEVIEDARRTVGRMPAQVIANAYEALGVRVDPDVAELIARTQRTSPGPETLERIRDGLKETWPPAKSWVYPACVHRPDPTRVLYSPCGECVLLDGPTIDMSRKVALRPE